MLGLGSATAFNLKEARERARSARQLLADGVDPLDVKRERQAEARLAEPVWTTKAITADRVRNRIENVLDWCVVRGHRPPGGDQTLARVLKRMGRDGITTHGMRSAFSDWAHEQTAHSNHTIEISLAHAVGSAVEKAYRRGPMVAKRARLMADWAKYCATPSVVRTGADVVAIGGSR